MEKQEFAMLAAAMRTYYSKENLLPNQQAMELWYQELKDIPYQAAEVALRKWVATNKWSPSIAEIREMSAEIVYGDIPDWGNGWKQVTDAMRNFGRERPKSAYASMDAITAEAAQQLGAWWNLCVSENQDAARANFRMHYEAIAKRERERRKTSPALAEAIGRLQIASGVLQIGERNGNG